MAEDIADGGLLGAIAADTDLVELGALLLDAENANVAGVMVAAGIDAARNLYLQIANLALPVAGGELARDFLRDRDRARIGQRTEVEPGTGDHVCDQTDIARRQLVLDEHVVDLAQVADAHMGKNEVLLVRHPQFVK
jgi:hypothetical protein